ncbi:MAG: type II secretion system protein [Planctomycetota bacterium]|nr:type II secretion system protein [Planctomycetota bacterium]
MNRRPNHSSHSGSLRTAGLRGGFTLIELMIVITIIVILAGLTIRVSMGMINQGREAATKSTIQKINRLLDSRLQAFQRKYGGNDDTSLARLKNTTEWSLAGNLKTSPNNLDLSNNQRVIITRKLLYMKWFPQVSGEVNLSLFPGISAARTTNGGTAVDSNSEILYAMLLDSQGLGEATSGLIDFNTTEFADTDLDGLPEFIDAWGEPIKFYRWPTRLFRPDDEGAGTPIDPPSAKYASRLTVQGLRPSDLKRDPMDPLGQCSNINNFETFFHQLNTFYAPLIISGGTDKNIGLLDPSDGFGRLGELSDPGTTDPATLALRGDALSDNISSLNIRAGGN